MISGSYENIFNLNIGDWAIFNNSENERGWVYSLDGMQSTFHNMRGINNIWDLKLRHQALIKELNKYDTDYNK